MLDACMHAYICVREINYSTHTERLKEIIDFPELRIKINKILYPEKIKISQRKFVSFPTFSL